MASKPTRRWARLEWLLTRVSRRMKKHGVNAAREAIRELMAPMSMSELAKNSGVDRSNFHIMVTANRGRIMHTSRRNTEKVLNIPPGSLGMVLAPIEDLREKEK